MNVVIDSLATITVLACGSAALVLGSEDPLLALPAMRIYSLLARRYSKDVDSKETLNRGILMLVLTFAFDLLLLFLMRTIPVMVWALTDICYIGIEVQLRISEHYLGSNSVQQIDHAQQTRERITISTS